MISRRDFLGGATSVAAALVTGARTARAQQAGVVHDSVMVMDSQNLFAMDQMAAQSVRLPAKPGAKPSMTEEMQNDLERKIHCQCGCTLDVFTCRTTDFSCQVSPAMHRDVSGLVQGGYSAQEILNAFTNVYGEKVLMAPGKSGFNLLAWVTPGIAVIAAGVAVSLVVKRWGSRPAEGVTPISAAPGSRVGATSDELARLEAAVKGEDDA